MEKRRQTQHELLLLLNGLYCSQTGFPEVLSQVVCGTKSIVAHKSARTEQQLCKKKRPTITAEQEVCSVFLPSEFKPHEEEEEEEEQPAQQGSTEKGERKTFYQN